MRRRRVGIRPAPRPPRPPDYSFQPSVPYRRQAVTRLVTLDSHHEKCGIREYGAALNEQLRGLGIDVRSVGLNDARARLSSLGLGDDLLVHAEPGLLSPEAEQALRGAADRGARVVVCLHYLDANFLARLRGPASALVQHRDYGLSDTKLRTIPLGCPVYAAPDRAGLRARYGLPADATLITTFGFLVQWKRFPEVALALLPLLRQGMHVQFLCSPHFSRYYQGEITLRQIAEGRSNLTLRLEFLPKDEVLDRIAASDVGFIYHGQDTGSVSAATKQFVSARCPLAVTESSHSSDLRDVVRLPRDIPAFCRGVVELASDTERRQALRARMGIEYERLNMRAIAQRYVELFEAT